ncbi:hypothetical protein E4T39_04153 [Aureobasidium subglaciale]|nr:hypothetical protein E4T39_04153 [Aureobasidium subglaciale]
MDLAFDQDLFHCKIRASAKDATSGKHVSIYLILDATHISAISLCGEADIPPDVTAALVKQARCRSDADIVSLCFTLSQKALVIVPDSPLKKRASTRDDVDTLLRLSQSEALMVYVPSDSLNHELLAQLCCALHQGSLKPTSAVLIKTLYAGAASRLINNSEELWGPEQPEGPPPYDPSTAPGASNDDASGQVDSQTSGNTQARKRLLPSPELYQAPAKRRLSEKAASEPWELAIAVQGAQLAALSAELATLRKEMQQLRRGPVVDAGTQTERLVEDEARVSPVLVPYNVSPSQTSTVENSIEERLIMVEDGIVDEQKRRTLLESKVDKDIEQRTLLEIKVDKNDEQLKQLLDVEVDSLQYSLDGLESRIVEHRQECDDNLDEKAMGLQIKLEDYIDQRLDDVEEVVKHDVRMAVENGAYTVNVRPSWLE